MKRLLSIAIAVSILVLWGSPGFTGEKYLIIPSGPAGKGGPIQHVTLHFEHDTSTDVWLIPTIPSNPSDPELFDDGIGRLCSVKNVQVTLKDGAGVDIVGKNPLLSDVWCLDPTRMMARVEAAGVLKGTFTHGSKEEIEMSGRMTLDLDLNVSPIQMKGYWIFQEGIGTHYGAFLVEGIVELINGVYVGSGTYKGWVRKNK